MTCDQPQISKLFFGAPTVYDGDLCHMSFRLLQNRSDRWPPLASTTGFKGEKALNLSRVSLSHYAREGHKCTCRFAPFSQFHTMEVYGAWKYSSTNSRYRRQTAVCGSLHNPVSINLRERFHATLWMGCYLDVIASEDVPAKKICCPPPPSHYLRLIIRIIGSRITVVCVFM